MARLPLAHYWMATALLLASGCAQAASASPSVGDTARPKPKHSDAVVLRVEFTGPPIVPIGRWPLASIYADGRVITQVPKIDSYPGPALPSLQIQQVKP